MMRIYNVFVKLVAIPLIGISCSAFAEEMKRDDVGNNVTVNIEVPPPVAAEQPKVMAPTPEMPAAPEDPVKPTVESVQTPQQMISNTQVVPVTSAVPFDASNQVTLQSVVLVNLPKADSSVVDKFVRLHNGGDFEEFYKMFSRDGFTVITGNFHLLNSKEGLKSHWDKKFSNEKFKNAKITSSLDSVQGLAPGLAVLTGEFNVSTDAVGDILSKFTMVVKYEDSEWKIVSMHGSSKDLMKMMLEAEGSSTGTGGMMMSIIIGLLGLLLGFGAAKVMRKK